MQELRDMININKGAQRSQKTAKQFCAIISHLVKHDFEKKEVFELYLELFTVMFLKSDELVKFVIVHDLNDVVGAMEDNIHRLFVEKKFGMHIFLYRLFQFKHCLNKPDECRVKDKERTKDMSKAFECPKHKDYDSDAGKINATKPHIFGALAGFLMTLLIKMVKVTSVLTSRDEVRDRVLYILFNFMENCEPELMYFPLRAIFEFFKGDSNEDLL